MRMRINAGSETADDRHSLTGKACDYLADPFDLTKMLDIPPGLTEMQGVASMLMKFYARTS